MLSPNEGLRDNNSTLSDASLSFEWLNLWLNLPGVDEIATYPRKRPVVYSCYFMNPVIHSQKKRYKSKRLLVFVTRQCNTP